jgi:hypothetical protein
VDQVQISEGLKFYFENGVVRSVHVCPPRLNFNRSETSVEVEEQCQIPSDQIIPGVGARGVALGWSEEKVMSVLANYKPVRQEWSPNAYLFIIPEDKTVILFSADSKKVMDLHIHSPAIKTSKGVGIGSSIADIKKYYKIIALGLTIR